MDLSSVINSTNTAVSLGNMILVSLQEETGYQPQDTSGNLLPKILFNYEGDQRNTLSSDITDHFTEDNSAIQDQIALKPVIIQTRGFIGELNNVPPAFLKPLQTAADSLQFVTAYAPSLSVTAQQAYNDAFFNYQSAKSASAAAVSAWSSINGQENLNQTQQQIYYGRFKGYWKSRTLFTIQTPWEILKNMAILNLVAIQSEETRMITDFEITFKQLNFAQTVRAEPERVSRMSESQKNLISSNNKAGRLANQTAPEVDFGTYTPIQTNTLTSVLP